MVDRAFERSTSWDTRSYWLHAAGPYEPSPPLDGDLRVDVAIVGGGYTGLWTAHFLKEADPGLDVAVLEQEVVGYGGSGRNGGFAMTVLDYSLHHLVTNYGLDRARAAHEAVARSVAAIGEFAEKHGFDCEYERTGFLAMASSPGQARRIHLDLEAAEKLGLEDWTYLDRKAVRAEVDSPLFECGVFEPTCALLQPAKLVRGIKDAVISEGTRVFERTPVTAVEPGPTTLVLTPTGTVRADKVVLATNPWTFRFPMIGLRALPLYTYILLTEPLTEEQLSRIGWERRQGLENRQNYLNYFRITRESRLMWGGEARYFYGPSIDVRHDRDAEAFRTIEGELRRTFPQLSDVGVEYRWGGPIAVTDVFLPAFGTVPGTGVHYGYGYSGHGVAPSHTGGQILRDLVLGRDSEHTNLVMVREARKFPPEPATFLGERVSRRALKKQDRDMAAGRDVGAFEPWLLRILKKL